jgi:hypothetical protein
MKARRITDVATWLGILIAVSGLILNSNRAQAFPNCQYNICNNVSCYQSAGGSCIALLLMDCTPCFASGYCDANNFPGKSCQKNNALRQRYFSGSNCALTCTDPLNMNYQEAGSCTQGMQIVSLTWMTCQ